MINREPTTSDREQTSARDMTAPATFSHLDPLVPPILHELEAEVMEEIWERGECSVREVMEVLNAGVGKKRAYTTYMTIMVRLDRKGLLVRRRQGKTNFYAPRYTHDQYADLRARAELESIVDQFGDVALAHIARQLAGLDPRHRRALQRLARET